MHWKLIYFYAVILFQKGVMFKKHIYNLELKIDFIYRIP